MVKIYVLVLIGNVSVGFDVLGVVVLLVDGILLGDCVSVIVLDSFSLCNEGCFVSKLFDDLKENIVY